MFTYTKDEPEGQCNDVDTVLIGVDQINLNNTKKDNNEDTNGGNLKLNYSQIQQSKSNQNFISFYSPLVYNGKTVSIIF